MYARLRHLRYRTAYLFGMHDTVMDAMHHMVCMVACATAVCVLFMDL